MIHIKGIFTAFLCLLCLNAGAQTTVTKESSFKETIQSVLSNFAREEMPTTAGTIIFDKVVQKRIIKGLKCCTIKRESSDSSLTGTFLQFSSTSNSTVLTITEAQGLLDAIRWIKISCSPGNTEGRYFIEDKVNLTTYRNNSYIFSLETAGCRTLLDNEGYAQLVEFIDDTITIGRVKENYNND